MIVSDRAEYGKARRPAPMSTSFLKQWVGPLVAVPALLRAFAVDPALPLRRAGLAANALDTAAARLSIPRACALLEACELATGCDHFGFLVGRAARLDLLDGRGEVAKGARTIGEVIEGLLLGEPEPSSDGSFGFARPSGAEVEFGFVVSGGSVTGRQQLIDMYIAANVTIVRELRGRAVAPTSVSLGRAAPALPRLYDQFFRVSTRFDAPASSVHLRNA